jgi:hypothetical protein
MKTVALVIVYLGAVVAANVGFAVFGFKAEPWISMVLIGLDLTSRDYLHQAWGGRGLAWKMGTLIVAGSALSALFGWATAEQVATTIAGGVPLVALASAAGFASAASVDALTYGVLRQRWLRINGSNAASALVDSFVFPAVAFGGFDLGMGLYFTAVKFIGGAGWWLALGGWRDVRRLLVHTMVERRAA